MSIKSICIKMLDAIKFVYSEPTFIFKLAKIRFSRNKKILLLGTPIHGNYGDHLIAESERLWIEKYFREYVFLECTMPFSKYFFNLIVRNVKDTDIVMISGGGWLGSDWPGNELFVRSVLTSLLDKRVVILPQTVHYSEDNLFMYEGRGIYSKCKKLIFCLRDRQSFEFIINNGFCDKERTLLIPDFALYYPSVIHHNKIATNINLCFRDDIESSMSKDIQSEIIEFIATNSINSSKVTTNEIKTTIPLRKRKKYLNKKLKEIANCKFLITDRLHAMVMAVITDTPCIAFDNSTHKVQGVFQWLTNTCLVYLCDDSRFSNDVLKNFIDAGNNNGYFDKTIFESHFDSLSERIRG